MSILGGILGMLREPESGGGGGFTPDLGQYNNVYYVATTGNDSTGTGTTGNPFLTIAKALTMCADGDAIKLGVGTFAEAPAAYYLTRMSALLVTVAVDIIGEPGETVVTSTASANPPQYSVLVSVNMPNLTDYINFYNIIFDDNGYDWYAMYGGAYLAASPVILCRAQLFNCAFISTATARIIYTNGEYNNCFNCSFNLFAFAVHENGAAGKYAWQNCVFSGTFTHINKTTCLDNATFDSAFNVTVGTWIDVGTGTDADDDTQADLGVYGGTYPWQP